MTVSTSRSTWKWPLPLLAIAVSATVTFATGALSGSGTLAAEPQQRGTTASPAATKPATPSLQGEARGRAEEARRTDGPPLPGTQAWFVSWEWWKDEGVKKELVLSEDKARKIESIIQRRVSQMKPSKDAFEKELDKLDRMTRERVADEATYSLQVAQLEAIGARLRESRTVMLYAIYRELSVEQNQKLQDIKERRRNQNRNGRSGGPSKSH